MFPSRSTQRRVWLAGCVIPLVVAAWPGASLQAAGPPRGEPITYSKHVAPILFRQCASCHRPGEVGPFSLLSFKDAAKRAHFLKEVTASKRMPPWKPVPGYGE